MANTDQVNWPPNLLIYLLFCSCYFTGLETNRPNLLLGLAIVQKPKRPGSLPLEIDEKKPKMSLSKDPMWIPKPPILYGSDNLEIFQPYDPATPANTTSDSPPCPGSPSDSSLPGSVTGPPLSNSLKVKPPVSSSATAASGQVTSNRIFDQNPPASSEKTPLQTILNSLFTDKKTVSPISTDVTPKTTGNVETTTFTKLSGQMVDPIVQQYGQKSKVKEAEKEENDLDRPYDPEEEYAPTGLRKVDLHHTDKNVCGALPTSSVDDDVAYDPEDETIFADIQDSIKTKPASEIQLPDSSVSPSPTTVQTVVPPSASTAVHTSTNIAQNLPTGTVVVSAATLTEQQRMLEELNKQIEEQKRQLKEQEEALRQQRETVGMFMAHFSVSDSLMSPPQKSLPLSQLSSLQSSNTQTETKITDKAGSPENAVDIFNLNSQVGNVDDATISNSKSEMDNDKEKDEALKNVQESERYSSAGEIEDSDVEYDPEDESLFNEIFEDGFQGCNKSAGDSSLSKSGQSTSHRGSSQGSYHSKKRRQSPKRRSRREKERHRSPSRRSHRHSPSHSQRRRGRDRHRRSERDRSRHRTKDNSVQQGRHRRDHGGRRRSHGHRGSPSPTKQDSEGLASKHHRRSSPNLGKDSLVSNKNEYVEKQSNCTLVESFSAYTCEPPQNVKFDIPEPLSEDLQKAPVCDHDNKVKDNNQQVDQCQQAELVDSKVESTIPLREIDPPTRDSPQSPDPEPQFSKPSNIEQSVCVKTEKISDSMGVTCSLGNDSKCLSNIRNLDFIALEVERSDSDLKNTKHKDEQSQDFSCSQTNVLFLKTEEHLSQPEISNLTTTAIVGGSQIENKHKMSEIGKDWSQNSRDKNLDAGGIITGTRQGLNQESLAMNCQKVGINANMDIAGFGRGSILNPKKYSAFDATDPGKDTLGSQGPHCWNEAQMARPGSNKNEFPNPPSSVEDSRRPIENVLIPPPGSQDKIITCNTDMRPTDNMHGFKRPDFTERGYVMHNQFLGNMGGPQDTHKRNSRGVIVERGPNNSDRDLYGSSEHCQQKERNEIHQEEIIPNQNKNLRGQGFLQIEKNNGNQPRQNAGFGSHTMAPDWHALENNVQDDWRGPVRIEPHIQDERRASHGERRGPNFEDLRHDRKGPECPVIIGPERRGIDNNVPMRGQRTPEGPGFTQPAPNRSGCDFNKRGPGGPDLWRSEPQRRPPIHMHCGLGAEDLRGPNLMRHDNEMRGSSMLSPGLNRRGPAGPNVSKPWLDNQGPNVGVSVTNQKGLPQSDFNEPRQEEESSFRKDFEPPATETGSSDFKISGPYRRGIRGAEYVARKKDCRDIPIGASQAESGDPDFRGPGVYGKDTSQGFREPWQDRNVLPMCELQPEWEGSRCPEFRGTAPDCVGTQLRSPGSERMMPGTNTRVPPMTDLRPERFGPAGPNFRRPEPLKGPFPEPENVAASNDWPVHERFQLTNNQRGPDFHREERKRKAALVGPGRNNKRQCSPDSRGGNWRDTSMQGQGPNSRIPGDQNTFGLGPRPHTGPPGLHYSGADMEAADFERKGQEGHTFRGPAPERRETEFERTGRGFPEKQQLRLPMPERRPLGMDSQGFDIRGPPLNVRPDTAPIEVPVDDRELTEPDFRGSDFEDRGPDFRGLKPDSQQANARYRESQAERRGPDMEGTERNWRRSGPLGHGNRRKSLNNRAPRHEKDQWEGSPLGVSEPILGSHDPGGFGPGKTVHNSRTLGPIGRHFRGPGPNMSTLDQEEVWQREDFGSAIPNRTVPHVEDRWPNVRGPKHEAVENKGMCPIKELPRHGTRGPRPFFEGPHEFQQHIREEPPLDWREPEDRVPQALQERPNMHERGPGEDWGVSNIPFRNDSDMECPGSRGRQLGNKWREPPRQLAGPNRLGHETFFRGTRGVEHVNSAPNKGEFEMEDIHQGDLRRMGFVGPERKNSNSNTEGPGTEGRQGPDMRRLMHERASRFNGPNQGVRFQGPTGSNPPQFSGPNVLSQNSEICDGFVKPHKHRGSLLPTPKGVMRFPNRTLNNSKIFRRNHL